MSHSSGEEKGTSDPGLNEWRDWYYMELKNGDVKIDKSNSGYTCPVSGCAGIRYHSLKELVEHASEGSWLWSLMEKAQHIALEKYASEDCGSVDEGKIVFPWIGVVANVRTEVKNGRKVGESGSKLRDELITKGYNPLKVNPVWNFSGHTGIALVEFKKDWGGYGNALKFEKDFEQMQCGKADYLSCKTWSRGNKLFGWLARDAEYHSNDAVGKILRKKTDLMSLSDIVAGGERKDSQLVSFLKDELSVKHEHLVEMENKNHEVALSINELIVQKDAMTVSYNEEMAKMQENVRDDFRKILLERERANRDMEAQRLELERQEKQLHEREKHNEYEISKLKLKKEMNEKAILEQKKTEAEVLSLAQEHQREKEKMHKKILELETQLDAKQAAELEIEQLRGALQVMRVMNENEEDDPETRKQKEEMREKLRDEEENLEHLENMNQALMIKQIKVEQELKEGHKVLIKGLLDLVHPGRASIGAKRTKVNEEAELWHFKEKREATLVEGIDYLCNTWKRLK